jgi:hypothetical protein
VINVATLILRRLRKTRLDNFSALSTFTRSKVDGGEFLFLPAINLLFLLGLVEYRPKTDSFEYVGRS